jgi:hypothetical protein
MDSSMMMVNAKNAALDAWNALMLIHALSAQPTHPSKMENASANSIIKSTPRPTKASSKLTSLIYNGMMKMKYSPMTTAVRPYSISTSASTKTALISPIFLAQAQTCHQAPLWRQKSPLIQTTKTCCLKSLKRRSRSHSRMIYSPRTALLMTTFHSWLTSLLHQALAASAENEWQAMCDFVNRY